MDLQLTFSTYFHSIFNLPRALQGAYELFQDFFTAFLAPSPAFPFMHYT